MFTASYLAITGLVAAYSVLTSPWLLFGMLVLFTTYLFLFQVYKDLPVQVRRTGCSRRAGAHSMLCQ